MNNNDPFSDIAGGTPATQTHQERKVVLSPAEMEASKKHKANMKRTVSQTPAYRAASNLNYVIVQVLKNCPRKLRVVCDNIDQLGNTLLSSLYIAYEDASVRCEMLTESRATVSTIKVKLQILRQLGYISKDDYKKICSLCISLDSQLAAWRNSVNRQSSATE